MAQYAKLGYGNADDVQAAIALGIIDGKDLVITRDTSELMYVRDDLSVQTIRPRTLLFDTVSEANDKLREMGDSYSGETVMIKDEDGKYAPWIVQKNDETGLISVEPFYVAPTNFQWTEF